MLTFGVTVLPDPPHTRFVELMQLAEEHGFEYGWTYDSHILWHDAYPLLTLLAVHTDKLKFGHCVTNPGTREPTVTASAYATLHAISDGRAVMGIGRGDSARRVIGYEPVKMAEFEASCRMMKDLMNGRPVEWNGKELELEWAKGRPEIPKDLADYVKARKFYDYKDHSREGAAHGEFVSDEICDRFSVIGSLEQVREKLRELDSVGVDHFNIYLMTHGQEDTLASYGREIIPELKGAAV